MGIKKEHRLKKAKDIKYVVQKGKKVRNVYYTLLYINSMVSKARLGIFIKRTRLSIRRNKEKRHIREIMRNFIKDMKDYDIIVIQHKVAFSLNFHSKEKKIWELLKNAKLFKDDNIKGIKALSIYFFIIFSFFL